MQIQAWLEEREIRGLRRAFRGRVSCTQLDTALGVGSVQDLHRALDQILRDGGLLEDEDEG